MMVGKTTAVVPLTVLGIPLPDTVDASQENVYGFVVPVWVAVNVAGVVPPTQRFAALVLATTPSGILTVVVIATLGALSQDPLTEVTYHVVVALIDVV